MDELLANLHEVSLVLLPILGVAVLIYLVMLLKKIISVFSRVDMLLVAADKKIDKLDGPLDTMVRLSHSVDMVHEASVKGVKGVVDYSIANFGAVNDWFQDILHKEKASDDQINKETSVEQK